MAASTYPVTWALDEPIWLLLMRSWVGITEIPGASSNPVILRWNRDIGGPRWFTNDDQAWCAIAANRSLKGARLPMALGAKKDPFDLLRARTFLAWGVPLTGPALGAFVVYDRPGGAHVNCYLGERGDAILGIGGNQRNAFTDDCWISRDRVLGYRWPEGVPLPVITPILYGANGAPLSMNEA